MTYNWSSEKLTINGKIGIGKPNPDKALEVEGEISATENITAADFVIDSSGKQVSKTKGNTQQQINSLNDTIAEIKRQEGLITNQKKTITDLKTKVNSLQQLLDQEKSKNNKKLNLINSVLIERLEKEGDIYFTQLEVELALASYEKAQKLDSQTAEDKINDANCLDQRKALIKLSETVTMEFVPIPRGIFMMGGDNDDEKSKHWVSIKQFWMGKYPVTQAQWQAIMADNNPSGFKGTDLPVEQVTWDDAVNFCEKLSEKTKLKFRLPSEAEWEYSCRAGSQTSYCFGGDSSQLKDYAWYEDNSNNQTHPVGGRKPNAWGLYDMHGNVWEWCADNWHNNYKGALTDESICSNNSNNKIVRGGSWDGDADDCRCAYRYSCARDDSVSDGGFRIALSFSRVT